MGLKIFHSRYGILWKAIRATILVSAIHLQCMDPFHIPIIQARLSGRYLQRKTHETNNIFDEQSKTTANIFHGQPGPIVGGYPVQDRDRYPYIVSIVTAPSDNPNRAIHTCGGTLITPNVVLSAAHCVGDPRNIYYVQFGRYMLNDNEGVETYKISDVYLCTEYSIFAHDCDFSLLKLEDTGLSKWPTVRLLRDSSYLDEGQEVTIAGWGATSEDGMAASVILREVQVNLISKDECSEAYGKVVTDDMICAYAKGKDACSGDSGGPMLLKGTSPDTDYQIAVISWGEGCAREEAPGVYTDLTSPGVIQFIDDLLCGNDEFQGLSPQYCKDGEFVSSDVIIPATSSQKPNLCKNVNGAIEDFWWTCDRITSNPSWWCNFFQDSCPEYCCPDSCDPAIGCL